MESRNEASGRGHLPKWRMREIRRDFRKFGGRFEFDKGGRDAVWAVYDGVRIGYSFICSDWFCESLHSILMCFLLIQEHFDLIKIKDSGI